MFEIKWKEKLYHKLSPCHTLNALEKNYISWKIKYNFYNLFKALKTYMIKEKNRGNANN